MELTREAFYVVNELAQDVGMSAQAYTPAGGFGQVLGVAGTMTEFVKFTVSLATAALDAEQNEDEANTLPDLVDAIVNGRTSTNSFGMDTIFYWPSVEIVA